MRNKRIPEKSGKKRYGPKERAHTANGGFRCIGTEVAASVARLVDGELNDSRAGEDCMRGKSAVFKQLERV
ncbi:MAG: hypothetical protein LBT59_03890 [Clostridiales bacterium]|nr:hypothetical protein [Clostridiales bacterium]